MTAPATSKRRAAPSRRLSASSTGASAAAARPIGTLTNSTHCQPSVSVSTPPSSTPAAPPEPATAPQTPSALLRSAPSLKVVVTIDSAAGESSAAPRPCTARAAISQASVCARPPASEAPANRISPTDEHAPPPEQVGHAPAQQQEAAEGQHVGVDDPGQVLLGEVEVLADRRQRDVDDRRVEHDDELGAAEQRQRQPAAALENLGVGHGRLPIEPGQTSERRRSAYGFRLPQASSTRSITCGSTGMVATVGLGALDRVDHVHALDDFAEHRVLAVEPGSLLRRDEKELRAVGVGTGVGHRQRAAHDLVVVDLVFERVAGAAGAGALRAAALDHEVLDHAVKGEPVVEAVARRACGSSRPSWGRPRRTARS